MLLGLGGAPKTKILPSRELHSRHLTASCFMRLCKYIYFKKIFYMQLVIGHSELLDFFLML